jgi:hypothetical protein
MFGANSLGYSGRTALSPPAHVHSENEFSRKPLTKLSGNQKSFPK